MALQWFDGASWQDYITTVICSDFRQFGDVVKTRILPVFDGIKDEADDVAIRSYQDGLAQASIHLWDERSLIHSAEMTGFQHHEMLTSMKWATIRPTRDLPRRHRLEQITQARRHAPSESAAAPRVGVAALRRTRSPHHRRSAVAARPAETGGRRDARRAADEWPLAGPTAEDANQQPAGGLGELRPLRRQLGR